MEVKLYFDKQFFFSPVAAHQIINIKTGQRASFSTQQWKHNMARAYREKKCKSFPKHVCLGVIDSSATAQENATLSV